MSAVWHSGRESVLLDDIIAGRKTIEGRLCKGKFAEYSAGDEVILRRDRRDENGDLQDGLVPEVRVRIVAARRYASFLEMITAEGFRRVIPSAASSTEAADVYNRYYSVSDQERYGVLAIEVQYIGRA